MVSNQDGIFSKAEKAGAKYNEAKAREVLETVLLGDAQYEKHSNKTTYNQDDFLDKLIKKEIPEAEIRGDIVILGDYAFELDRSVPRIGKTTLNPKDLIWPVVTVAEVTQADATDNYMIATISITASIDEKAENKINRIEIWQNGLKLDTIQCNNEKTVTTTYLADNNGIYTIKAYADIAGSAKTTVEGIVPAVEFTPNGSTDWKKSHTTTISARETREKVTSIQYLWKKSSEEKPQVGEFKVSCTNNSQITGQGETMTGKYKLWVYVILGTGTNQRTYISGSKEFYFDNSAPEITAFLYNPKTATTYNFSCNADDHDGSGIEKYEIYMQDEIINQHNGNETTYTSIDFNEVKDKSAKYKVIVYDKSGNHTESEVTNRDDINIWKKYDLIDNSSVKLVMDWTGGGRTSSDDARNMVTFWSLSPELIKGDSYKYMFADSRTDSGWEDLVKAGTNVYVIDNFDQGGGNLSGWAFYAFTGWDEKEDRVWLYYGKASLDEKYDKGDFICYENYSKSSTNPTEGKYNGKYYELPK